MELSMFLSMNSEKRRHSLLLTLESNAYNITDVGPFSYSIDIEHK